jgi:putative heme transporter
LDTLRPFERVPRSLLRAALVAGTAVVVTAAALHFRSSLPSLSRVGRPAPPWAALALLAQLASLLAYALIVREFLAARGVSTRVRGLLRGTIGGIALGASLPGGQALSTAYWYRLLRQEGAPPATAAVALAGAMLAGVASLTGVLVLGVAAAGDSGPTAGFRLPILVGAAAAVALGRPFGRRLARLARSLITRFTSVPPDQLAVHGRPLLKIACLAYLNWLLDCACLLASLHAVGAYVPLRSVLLTYALAQVVASIPLLPGGGGTVEVTLSLGFAAFGHTSSALVAGVLLFRLISCWGLIPIGWAAIALDGRSLPRWFNLSTTRLRPARAGL